MSWLVRLRHAVDENLGLVPAGAIVDTVLRKDQLFKSHELLIAVLAGLVDDELVFVVVHQTHPLGYLVVERAPLEAANLACVVLSTDELGVACKVILHATVCLVVERLHFDAGVHSHISLPVDVARPVHTMLLRILLISSLPGRSSVSTSIFAGEDTEQVDQEHWQKE